MQCIALRSSSTLVLRTTVLLALVACAVSGCGSREPARGSATLCGAQAGAADVFIEITYDAQGMPAATPETCAVPAGANVAWRGPAGVATAFEIRFKGANPSPPERGGVLVSSRMEDRQAVSRAMGSAAGRYAYGIRANGRERDPAIIIQ